MNKNLILAGLVLAGGLMASLPASAQSNTYNFDLVPTAGGATNSFHVILQKYNTATADLPGKMFRISKIVANTPGPNAGGVSVAIEYFGKLNGLGPHLTVGAITGWAGLSTGGSNPAKNVNTPAWTQVATNNPGVNKYDLFSSTIPTSTSNGQIKKVGTSWFLQSSNPVGTMIGNVKQHGVASVRITVTGSGGQKWSAIQNVAASNVPEAGSLALLIPGLIPVGIALRKRSRKA